MAFIYGAPDGHTHYFSQIFIMASVYGAFCFITKRYARAKADGKFIEGSVVERGEHKFGKFNYFVKYEYKDDAGQQKEKKSLFRNKNTWDNYQVGQKITLISTADPTYLFGKKVQYVAIKESFNRSYDFFKKLLKYYPIGAALIVLCEYIFIGVY